MATKETPRPEKDKQNILNVHIGSTNKEEISEKIKQAEHGEDVEPIQRLVLPNYESLNTLTKKTNLDILDTIAQKEPSSINQLADMLDRDYREVHRNIQELNTMNIIEFKQNGKSKKPILRHSGIEINLEFGEKNTIDSSFDL